MDVLTAMESQQALFANQQARDQYFEEVRQKAIRIFGLPISSDPAESFQTVRVTLPDRILWGTPDNLQTRDALANEIIRKLRDLIQLNAITRLQFPGVKLEIAPRNGLQYTLLASVCY
jgi:hypothetical protein